MPKPLKTSGKRIAISISLLTLSVILMGVNGCNDAPEIPTCTYVNHLKKDGEPVEVRPYFQCFDPKKDQDFVLDYTDIKADRYFAADSMDVERVINYYRKRLQECEARKLQ